MQKMTMPQVLCGAEERLACSANCSTSAPSSGLARPLHRVGRQVLPALPSGRGAWAGSERCSSSSGGAAVGPLRAAAPVKEAVEAARAGEAALQNGASDNGCVPGTGDWVRSSASISAGEILGPVRGDMEAMAENLRNVVGNRHPLLMAAAEQIFGAGGKKLRPALVFLVARATARLQGLSDITDKQRRLAEITEMIHTASLVHDDVVDDCNTRRGAATVNSRYGTKVAVLAGDFLFAQSSYYLAHLDNLEVIKLISQVIADFANGEISQIGSLFDTGLTLQQYSDKSFYKTATLIAASCKSAAVFSGVTPEVKEAMFEYGRHLGLAFQVVDDILDFTQTAEQLGKPQGQDLAMGNLTAPAIFALQSSKAAELEALIDSEFAEEGSLQQAIELIHESGGVAAARKLARQEADMALDSLKCLPECPEKRSLELMVDYVLDRLS